MTKEEVLNVITIQPRGYIQEIKFKKKFPVLYEEIINLSFPKEFKWTQKLYHYFHDDLELNLGHCPICGKRCKFINFILGYSSHCSRICVGKDENVSLTRKETTLKNLGVENPFQSEDVKFKIAETNLKKYGDTSYARTPECREKMRQTSLNRYNEEYYSRTDEYKERFKETCLNNMGVENPFQSEMIKEKIKQTCKNKYHKEFYVQTNEYKERVKETNLKNLGVENPFQSEMIKEKIKQTCKKRYGEDNYTKTHEYHKRRRKRLSYNGLMFDSSWEIIVYQYCRENNIPCVYQPDIQFIYFYEGKRHVYQPDFLINDKLYEIKGDQFFDGDKMINPFDRTQDELLETKHQCMIKNNVIILRKNDINNLKEVIC